MADQAVSLEANLKQEHAQASLGEFAEDGSKKTPFDVYIYPNLFDQKTFEQIRQDVGTTIRLKKKDNDLYRFKQSKDLKTEVAAKKLTPTLSAFIDTMLDQVRQKLEQTTGLKLSSKHFDITASRYDQGDYLLCHNDDIKNSLKQHRRALAFIYYLNTRRRTRQDGGALVLYDSDETGEPISVNNTIQPRPNSLVVFRTSSRSWHSVEEVFCKDDQRLSINGWFHVDNFDKQVPETAGDGLKCIEPNLYEFLRPVVLVDRVEKFFHECISKEYLMEKTCFLIRRKFKKKSEINLTNFLVKEKFDEICAGLREATKLEENLKQIGPYNKRNYKLIKLDKLPQICRDLYDAFQSELFFMLMSRLTGLDLEPPSLQQSTEPGQASTTEDDDDGDEEEEEDEDDDDDDDDDDDGDEDDDVDNLEDEESSEGDEEGDQGGTRVDPEDLRRQAEESTSKDENIIEKIAEAHASAKSGPAKRRKRVSDPLVRMEFRHLEQGSYTLIHDHAYELGEKSALDVVLHFNHDFAVNFDDGGYISYLDGTEDDNLHDMDCELLTIEPKSNCLSLAYRCDESTCRFLKYLARTHKANYQDLYCVFYEKPEDLPRASDAKSHAKQQQQQQEVGGSGEGEKRAEK